MIKAAALVRVSSKQQASDKRHSIPVQLASVKEYASRNGLEVLEEYVDALSGAHERRDNFYRLLADADRYQAVVIYHTDRLGRDEELSHRFLRLLLEAGLIVHSVHRGGVVETGLATSAEIMIAAEERRNIIRRTRAARMAMAAKGLLPTGIKTYGYKNAGGSAVIDPGPATVVRRIFEWSAAGKAQNWIQDTLNAEGVPVARPSQSTTDTPMWHRTVISKLLRNRAYKGDYHWGKYLIAVPPIVSPDLWQRGQPRLRGPRSTSGWPLISHLRCGVCGRRMTAKKSVKSRSGRVYEEYSCQSRSLPTKSCGAKNLKREWLEVEVEQQLRTLLQDRAALAEFLAVNEPPDIRLSEQLAELSAQDARWLEAFKLGAITPAELSEYRREIEGTRKALSTPQVALSAPTEMYLDASKAMPLRELLELTGVVAVATREFVRLTLE